MKSEDAVSAPDIEQDLCNQSSRMSSPRLSQTQLLEEMKRPDATDNHAVLFSLCQ